MSTGVAPTADIGTGDDTGQRLDLHARFLRAGFADPSLFRGIPQEVMLVLLPDDDPEFVERETARAARAARRGQDVYLRHLRVADLPPLREPTGPRPGDRRARYAPDGTTTANLVLGPGGEWRDTDEPFPSPRDDESDPLFRF